MNNHIFFLSSLLSLSALLTACSVDEGPDFPAQPAKPSMIDAATPQGVMPDNQNIGTDWRLTFSDEFEGSQVDTTKWVVLDERRGARTQHGIADWYFSPENVTVSGGNLHLANTKPAAGQLHCASVYSNHRYFMRYGYAEARIQCADIDAGALTAFWLQSNTMGVVNGTGNDGAEVDIFESAYMADEVITTIHYDGYSAPAHQEKNFRYPTSGVFSGYHTWGCLWDEQSVKIYYDGQQTCEFTGDWVPRVAEFLYLSTVATFGDKCNFRQYPAGGQVSEALFDYVRVWVRSTPAQ